MSFRLAPIALVTLAGCTTIGSTTTALNEISTANAAAVATMATAVPVVATPVAASAHAGPFPEMTEQEAMAAVAPMLSDLATADPALHAEVLEQLAGTKPSLWSLTVQRAQHTLAYKQQLAGQSTPPAQTQVAQEESFTPVDRTRILPKPPAPADDQSQVVQASAAVDAPAAPMPAVIGGDPMQKPAVIQNHHLKDEEMLLAMASAKPDRDPSAPQAKALFPPEPKTPTDWRGHVDAAITQLGADASAPPTSVDEARERLRLQLLHLVAGDTKRAVAPAAGLSAAEQGYWSNQLYALSTMLDENGSSDVRARIDAAVRHQSEASAKLRSMGALQVRNFIACREVYGYGAYEPLPDAQYAPGDQIILYAELDNYRSDATAEGYRTTFDSSYRLVNEAGDEVASGDFPEVDDLCLTLRRDFHIQYAVTLPTTVAPGDYRLELSVTDRLGKKIGHDEMTVTVAPR